MSHLRLVAALGAAAALAACSSQPGDITAAGEKVLKPKVQRVREAAASGSYASLHAQVNSLKKLVDRERAAGDVTDARANAIDDAADQLLVDAAPTSAPTTAAPTPSATRTPSPSPSPTPTPTPTPTATPTDTSSPAPTTTITVP